jgi:NADPH-dependent curcumin reductase CurA
MGQTADINRRIVLAARPKGAPTPEHFRLERQPVPTPGAGQVLLRTVFLSLDPYMRGRMNDGPSYAKPVEIGEPMVGGTVSRVAASNNPKFAVGDWVLSYAGWQDYALSDGRDLFPLPGDMKQPSVALGALGMPGFTAYMGLLDIGAPQPGETVAVAAATGGVGSVVGQIAKIKGCRAVGIAGGAEKCRFAVEQLGFDACVDHHAADLREQLAAAAPKGIDVYFENVGGKVLNAVVPLLNVHARVPLCGIIAQYNADRLPDGPDRTPILLSTLLTKRIKMQGFIINLDYGNRFPEFLAAMGPWVAAGRVRHHEDRVDSLEAAPAALIGLLDGKNFGKVVVAVGPA